MPGDELKARRSKPRGGTSATGWYQPSLPLKNFATQLRPWPEPLYFLLVITDTIVGNGDASVRSGKETSAVTKKDRAEILKLVKKSGKGRRKSTLVDAASLQARIIAV